MLTNEKRVNYILLTSEITVDGETQTTYGIGAVRDEIMIDSVYDVSLEREKVEEFIKLCNNSDLDICHLRDIAEDAAV